MSEERKFDEAAFDKAVAKPNGWSGVADPVAEIRKMRDGDEAFGKDVLRTALSLVRAHFDGAEGVFLEKSRELAARLDKEGRGDLASFVRAQTGDEPSWVPMERKRRAGNVAALRAALNQLCENLLNRIAGVCPNLTDEGMLLLAEKALAAPPRNCDRCEFWEDLWGLEFVKLWPDVTDDLQRAWLFVRWLFAPAKGKEPDNG